MTRICFWICGLFAISFYINHAATDLVLPWLVGAVIFGALMLREDLRMTSKAGVPANRDDYEKAGTPE